MLRATLVCWITAAVPLTAAAQPGPTLPKPFATPSVTKHPKVVGWPAGRTPIAPAGFRVEVFAKDLDNPRWLHVLPNGDVLVAEARTPKAAKDGKEPPSANRITLLRDTDGDGTPDVREVFLRDLNQPFGMLLLGDHLYVANTDALLRFPYTKGQTRIKAKGESLLALPAGGYNNHWTRNVVANKDGSKLYVSVGSASDVAEHGIKEEQRRANILEVNPDGTGERVFASGLRNPVGMDWEPTTGRLWTAVNERDKLGDDLVPDYLTSVQDGGFYGWPYAYFGKHEEPRRKGERPDLVAKSLTPDVPLGAHTASLGLRFYRGTAFPAEYRGGAFVGQRGSWNRSQFAGYRVAFVPFAGGRPAAGPRDFLTGFIKNDAEVYGRPVGLAELPDGSLLVADDAGNRVWRVRAEPRR